MFLLQIRLKIFTGRYLDFFFFQGKLRKIMCLLLEKKKDVVVQLPPPPPPPHFEKNRSGTMAEPLSRDGKCQSFAGMNVLQN